MTWKKSARCPSHQTAYGVCAYEGSLAYPLVDSGCLCQYAVWLVIWSFWLSCWWFWGILTIFWGCILVGRFCHFGHFWSFWSILVNLVNFGHLVIQTAYWIRTLYCLQGISLIQFGYAVWLVILSFLVIFVIFREKSGFWVIFVIRCHAGLVHVLPNFGRFFDIGFFRILAKIVDFDRVEDRFVKQGWPIWFGHLPAWSILGNLQRYFASWVDSDPSIFFEIFVDGDFFDFFWSFWSHKVELVILGHFGSILHHRGHRGIYGVFSMIFWRNFSWFLVILGDFLHHGFGVMDIVAARLCLRFWVVTRFLWFGFFWSFLAISRILVILERRSKAGQNRSFLVIYGSIWAKPLKGIFFDKSLAIFGDFGDFREFCVIGLLPCCLEEVGCLFWEVCKDCLGGL